MRWWTLAKDWTNTDSGGPGWLGFYLTITGAKKVADAASTAPPTVYLLPTFAGYALRAFVDQFATARPLVVPMIDPSMLPKFARRPWNPETGLLSIENISESDAQDLEPIASLAVVTAADDDRFSEIVSVTSSFWRTAVSIAIDEVRRAVEDPGIWREPPSLSAEAAESSIRYGFVLRCIEEAFGIAEQPKGRLSCLARSHGPSLAPVPAKSISSSRPEDGVASASSPQRASRPGAPGRST